MMNTSRKLLLTGLLCLVGFSVSAQEFKVGIVNLDRIFREANSAKAAQTKLELEFGKREKELNDVATQLKPRQTNLSVKRPHCQRVSVPLGKSSWLTKTGTFSASAVSFKKI